MIEGLLAGKRIVPVVVIDDAADAPELAAALVAGGIHAMEITLRTDAGLAAIRRAARNSEMTVGAGTVLTVEQVDRCVDAGAQFIVSPGFDERVVERAIHHGVAVLPGVATPTEVQRALTIGLRALKFFPADRLGGIGTIGALSSVFRDVKFMPSGGVTAENAPQYLADPAVFAVSGSWMVPRASIVGQDFARITTLSSQATAS